MNPRGRIFKIVLKHILCLLIIMSSYFVLDALKVYCPIRHFTGVPCPTCGATRAMFCLLRLDFSGYLYYNPVAALILAAGFIGLHSNTFIFKPFKKNHVTMVICSLSAIVFLCYIIRLSFTLIP